MKANKAPEKIWINSPKDLPCGFVDKSSVECTSTDAFIDKAVEWLKKNIEDYMYVLYDKDGRPTNNVRVATLCFEAFKNYMKGE